MPQTKDNNSLAILKQMVNENGNEAEAVTETFCILLNETMKFERDQVLKWSTSRNIWNFLLTQN